MKKRLFLFCFIIFMLAGLSLIAADRPNLSEGQTIYVSAYSHIYFGNREKPFLLTITLSIRNIDPTHRITITEVDYYETQGRQLERFIDEPVVLDPLESLRYVIPEHDESGGSGANFIVKWTSDRLVNAPIVESVMIGTKNQQGISFTSQG